MSGFQFIKIVYQKKFLIENYLGMPEFKKNYNLPSTVGNPLAEFGITVTFMSHIFNKILSILLDL